MLSIAELRDGLKLPPDQDEKLVVLKQQLISLWESQTGMLWDKRDGHIQVIRTRTRSRVIFLELTPVTEITKVEVREPWESSWTELEASKYLLIGKRRLRRLDENWPELVQITYDGGTDSADALVKQALIVQANFMSVRTAAGTIAVKSQNFEGGGGVLEEATMHPFFKQVVELNSRKA